MFDAVDLEDAIAETNADAKPDLSLRPLESASSNCLIPFAVSGILIGAFPLIHICLFFLASPPTITLLPVAFTVTCLFTVRAFPSRIF